MSRAGTVLTTCFVSICTVPAFLYSVNFFQYKTPCILPVSDLRNYNEVLQNVTEDSPVFLTKNGRGCYVVIDIKEYERMVAELKLQKALAEGEHSAEQGRWLSAADVRKKYEV